MFGFPVAGLFNVKGFLFVAGVASVLSAGAASVATVKVYEVFVVPGREAAVKARVEENVSERIAAAEIAASAIAKNAEAARQRRMAANSLRLFQLQYAERQRTAEARVEELERANNEYVERLKKAGRFRPLNGADIDFLRGVRDKAN